MDVLLHYFHSKKKLILHFLRGYMVYRTICYLDILFVRNHLSYIIKGDKLNQKLNLELVYTFITLECKKTLFYIIILHLALDYLPQ